MILTFNYGDLQDIKKKMFAESKNFKVLYIWESDINNNDFESLREILEND